MKILIYISSLTAGGAEKVATMMANYWSERYDVVLLTNSDITDDFFVLSDKVERKSTGFIILQKNIFYKIVDYCIGLYSIRKIVKNIKPDVIISHMDVSNIHMLLATINIGIPILVEDHNNPELKPISQPWKALKPLTYFFADKLILLIPELEKYYSKYFYRHSKILFIENPLDIPIEIPDSIEVILNKPTFIAMGSLTYQKGYEYLLEAFAKVHLEKPEWNLTILGGGPLHEQLTSLAKKLKIEHKVYFSGRVKNPYEVLKDADIYVMSSRYEGFPVALCEAMGVGLPCISFDCPTGPRDIIEHNVNGLLVEYLNIDALAETMLELSKDVSLRKNISKEAVKIREKLSLQAIMLKWENAIEKAKNNK